MTSHGRSKYTTYIQKSDKTPTFQSLFGPKKPVTVKVQATEIDASDPLEDKNLAYVETC